MTVLHGVRDVLDSRTTNRVMQVLVILSLVAAGFIGWRQYELTNCLSEYNNAAAASQAARAAAAAEDRRADEQDRQANEADRLALKAVFDALGAQDQATTRAAFAAAILTFQRTDAQRKATVEQRAENERKRQENPLPPPPSLRCG